MTKIQLKILDARLGESIDLPVRATSGSAGLDLKACVDNTLVLEPGAVELIPTGMAIYIETRVWRA